METLGERLSALRIKRGITAKEVAERTKVNDIGRFEKNERKPSLDSILAIAKFYKASVDWLLTGEGEITRGKVSDNSDYILSPQEIELIEHFNQLDHDDRISELSRIKTIIEVKERIKSQTSASSPQKRVVKKNPAHRPKPRSGDSAELGPGDDFNVSAG
jgi:transcriptional regulator with XRE-family HTH domain